MQEAGCVKHATPAAAPLTQGTQKLYQHRRFRASAVLGWADTEYFCFNYPTEILQPLHV